VQTKRHTARPTPRYLTTRQLGYVYSLTSTALARALVFQRAELPEPIIRHVIIRSILVPDSRNSYWPLPSCLPRCVSIVGLVYSSQLHPLSNTRYPLSRPQVPQRRISTFPPLLPLATMPVSKIPLGCRKNRCEAYRLKRCLC
jgi:hypothetical protein